MKTSMPFAHWGLLGKSNTHCFLTVAVLLCARMCPQAGDAGGQAGLLPKEKAAAVDC